MQILLVLSFNNMLAVVYKSFAFIHGIQNEVLSWVGGRDQDLGGAQKQVDATALAMTGMATRGSSFVEAGAANARGKAQQRNDQSIVAAAQQTQDAALSSVSSSSGGSRSSGGGSGNSLNAAAAQHGSEFK